jgi:hypothetical protein
VKLIEINSEVAQQALLCGLVFVSEDGVLELTELGKQTLNDYLTRRLAR